MLLKGTVQSRHIRHVSGALISNVAAARMSNNVYDTSSVLLEDVEKYTTDYCISHRLILLFIPQTMPLPPMPPLQSNPSPVD